MVVAAKIAVPGKYIDGPKKKQLAAEKLKAAGPIGTYRGALRTMMECPSRRCEWKKDIVIG